MNREGLGWGGARKKSTRGVSEGRKEMKKEIRYGRHQRPRKRGKE